MVEADEAAAVDEVAAHPDDELTQPDESPLESAAPAPVLEPEPEPEPQPQPQPQPEPEPELELELELEQEQEPGLRAEG